MSSLRLKERGGAGAKIMASNPHKPHPTAGTPRDKSAPRRTTLTAATTAAAAGKENSRSISRGRVAPPEKPAAAAALPSAAALRWSTSSLPRGKPSNTPDLTKLIPDRAAAAQRKSFAGFRGLERCQQEKLRLDSGSKPKDEKPVVRARLSESRKSVGSLPAKNSSLRGSDANPAKNVVKAASFNMNPEKSSLKSVNTKVNSSALVLDSIKEGNCVDSNSNAPDEPVKRNASALPNLKEKEKDCQNPGSSVIAVVDKSNGSSVADLDRKVEVGEPASERIRVFDSSREGTSEENGKTITVVNKYPSKLHEKLALLEGKVQKIASDIKRTKEMLDLNNPDESKLILSDIQNKISGIEKAVGHVIDGSKQESRPSETNVVDLKGAAKGLNHEELEARFFPHHRLLRNRSSVGSSVGSDHNCKTKQDNSRMKDSILINIVDKPIDENPIAIEFLASLNVDQPEIWKQNGIVLSDRAPLREVGSEKISAHHTVASKATEGVKGEDITLLSNEKFEEFDDQENIPTIVVHDITEESFEDELFEIGQKSSTGGWFVSEGEAVLLAHDDSSCSYYDIANLEVKAEYKPPMGVSENLWGDCWLVRAPGVDGCSGRYVVAASAGNVADSGFCSWDFYTREVKAFRLETNAQLSLSRSSSRTILAPLSNSCFNRRTAALSYPAVENLQWWYRPCGPLLISTATRQKTVSAYDIRDGELVMKWEVGSPVVGMEYSSPLQWRSRGKVIIAETEAISLWDVNSLNPQPLLSVPYAGKKLYSLHVNNTDADLGGGIRQRISSSEVEGNDGVFCTHDSVNVFDFRLQSGVGLKISRPGANGQSIFSRGDSIFIGCTEGRLPIRGGPLSQVQQFSLRKGKLAATYALPDVNSHVHHSSVTQVWGNSDLVMGICGMGLFVFDTLKDDAPLSSSFDCGDTVEVKETIGPDNLYCPTFDYLGSRVLVISRDRPAVWKYLS